jgi:hypothetical protein
MEEKLEIQRMRDPRIQRAVLGVKTGEYRCPVFINTRASRN